jgi:hypothetical protein
MATLRVYPSKRGTWGAKQTEGDVALRSATVTWSWGSQPSPGALTYVTSSAFPRIDVGSWLQLNVYGKTFYGVAVTGTAKDVDGNILPTTTSPDGREVLIEFKDPRLYLQWDVVWGMFNMEENPPPIIGGERIKRYWHIFPRDFAIGRKSFTLAPLKASQILNFIFRADTVETVWKAAYHPDQVNYPIYNVDFSDGRPLDEALAILSEEQGLVFAIKDEPFKLVWARKGFLDSGGQTIAIPANKQIGQQSEKLADNPARVWVVGDRNRYLVLDLTLTPDWNRNYEELARAGGVDGLTKDLYLNDAAFNSISGDPEHAQGWLLASARAKEITVREYAAFRFGRDGKDFNDYRMFGGRSRLDMPVALYLSEVVFRAYRPPALVGVGTIAIELRSLKIASELFAKVTHDVATGTMNAAVESFEVSGGVQGFKVTQPGVGNGYLIVQGVSLDPSHLMEFFAPERFVPAAWQSATTLWRPMTFQVDDSGEDGPFVILDEPAWASGDVFKMVNGHGVLNASPTLTPANVKAALCFEADRFRFSAGLRGGRDVAMNVPAIRREVVVQGGKELGEVLYGDGKTAAQKAAELASPRLGMPFIYVNGSYTWPLRDGDLCPDLDGMLQRVSLEYSPSGRKVSVEFTSERGKRAFTPDKDLDRATRMNAAFSGQKELRALAAADRYQAAAARQTRGALAGQVSNLLRGRGGVEARLGMTTIASPTGTLPAGTPLWRAPFGTPTVTAQGASGPATTGDYALTNTQSLMPSATTNAHTVLSGVVVRDGEDTRGQVRVCEHGPTRARVKGPIAAGDSIGRVNGQDYFESVETSDGDAVGTVEQDVEAGVVRLVAVRLGTGKGSGGEDAFAVWG